MLNARYTIIDRTLQAEALGTVRGTFPFMNGADSPRNFLDFQFDSVIPQLQSRNSNYQS
jgi:hypothetical protein